MHTNKTEEPRQWFASIADLAEEQRGAPSHDTSPRDDAMVVNTNSVESTPTPVPSAEPSDANLDDITQIDMDCRWLWKCGDCRPKRLRHRHMQK